MRFSFVLGSALLVGVVVQAHASTVRGGDSTFSGSGTLTASENSSNQLVVDSLTSDDYMVQLIGPTLPDVPGSGFNNNDNVLQTQTSPYLTKNGLAFFAMDHDFGKYEVDIFSSSSNSGVQYFAYIVNDENIADTIPISFSLVTTQGIPPVGGSPARFSYAFTTATDVTPEPASYALFGTGLLVLAGVTRRRFSSLATS